MQPALQLVTDLFLGFISSQKRPVMYSLRRVLYTILAISGFVLDHLNLRQLLLMSVSVLFAFVVLPLYSNTLDAIVYFSSTTVIYLGLICLVLPQHGLRKRWIQAYGEVRAYRLFEGLLAFAFFHNALGLTHISQSTQHSGFWGDLAPINLYLLVGLLLVIGMGTKIWSALVVGLPIYYWKDMFLGTPISQFILSGPYKYLSNPMYGVGQLPVYAIALYHNSVYGLLCGLVNQLLMFSFYYAVERPFIQRVYIDPST